MVPTTDERFHGYVIRVQTDKPFKAFVFHEKFPQRNTRIEYSTSLEETMTWAKEWIRSYQGDRDWKDVESVTVCFNAEFLEQIMGDERQFSFDFFEGMLGDGKMSVTIHDVFPFKAHDANRRGQDYRMSSGWASKEALIEAGLRPNCRYVLEDNSDGTFTPIFHSVVEDTNEKIRMGEPGITIAANR